MSVRRGVGVTCDHESPKVNSFYCCIMQLHVSTRDHGVAVCSHQKLHLASCLASAFLLQCSCIPSVYFLQSFPHLPVTQSRFDFHLVQAILACVPLLGELGTLACPASVCIAQTSFMHGTELSLLLNAHHNRSFHQDLCCHTSLWSLALSHCFFFTFPSHPPDPLSLVLPLPSAGVYLTVQFAQAEIRRIEEQRLKAGHSPVPLSQSSNTAGAMPAPEAAVTAAPACAPTSGTQSQGTDDQQQQQQQRAEKEVLHAQGARDPTSLGTGGGKGRRATGSTLEGSRGGGENDEGGGAVAGPGAIGVERVKAAVVTHEGDRRAAVRQADQTMVRGSQAGREGVTMAREDELAAVKARLERLEDVVLKLGLTAKREGDVAGVDEQVKGHRKK